ncbi:hypothetical protein [Streptomyces sp. JJ38]|uniref:hypothetical protein n=1 Tax=Streptomyces sp. JJ38 TaxID=2738128 RepID=UPI001C564639|nr:hypothetical protein [Streptomyces sp. JJ38]MBW1599108.1 hypothetical protein [Streptomyces sp. JJ38]
MSVDDGQLTGLPGVLVPCVCVPGSWASCSQCPERPADACGCWVACWPVNAGHTGWVPLPLDDIEDDGLLYRPCPVHPPVFRTAVTAEVAA